MQTIEVFEKKLKSLLNEKADELSISTGFIKRVRKIKGSSFAKALIVGNMGQESSLEGICSLFAQEEIAITKQGINLRFTQGSVKFMESLYLSSLSLMEKGLPINCEILKRFNSVKLLDSSYISLPNEMQDQYRGYGSSYKGRSPLTGSALKVQLVYDYLHQVITRLDLKEGIRSDQGYRDYLEDISAGDLLISDLGYFVPEAFKIIQEKQAYFISRYKSDTNLYNAHTHEKIDLLMLLKDQTFMTQEVLLGSQVKLKVRIVCQKLTQEQSAYRKRKADNLAKSRKYISSHRNQALLEWAIFITNIPTAHIPAQDLSTVYRLRWQIELLFKLYKSYGRIDKFHYKNSCRILCQLYSKLIIITIFHGMTNCLQIQAGDEFSPIKAFNQFKIRSWEFFLALRQEANNLGGLIKNIINSWRRFSLKDKYRKSRISTLSTLKLIPNLAPLNS